MTPAALRAAATPKGLAERAASDPALQRIRDAIAQRPTAGLVAVVTGPGGSGKTSAASWITEAYRVAGQPVAHLRDTPQGPWPLDTVLLAEDAHLLDSAAAAALRDFAATPGSRLVVTRRPWPETPEEIFNMMAAELPEFNGMTWAKLGTAGMNLLSTTNPTKK